MATAFSLTSTNSTAWISPLTGDSALQFGGSVFVLLSGTGTCKLEYSLNGTDVAAPDDVTMTGPGAFGPFVLPREVTHFRVTNVSGTSVGSVMR